MPPQIFAPKVTALIFADAQQGEVSVKSEGLVTVVIGLIGTVGTVAAGALGYQAGSKAVDKDYVQMAIANLDRKDASPELRKWSVDVLSKLSPVPFGKKLETQLAKGPAPLVMTRLIAERLNVPPVMAERCPDVMKGWGKNITDDQAFKVVNQYDRCRIRMNALLDLIDGFNKINDDFNAKQAKENADLANGLKSAGAH